MEGSQNIRKAKKYDLVFEMAVLSLESGFSFIILTNLYPIIGIGKVQLDESPCPTKPIQQLANQKKWILVFDDYIVEILIIFAKAKIFI